MQQKHQGCNTVASFMFRDSALLAIYYAEYKRGKHINRNKNYNSNTTQATLQPMANGYMRDAYYLQFRDSIWPQMLCCTRIVELQKSQEFFNIKIKFCVPPCLSGVTIY